MEKIKVVTISVDGSEYAVRTNESTEHMQRIALFCDEKLKQISANYPHYGLSLRYKLTMLEMADELCRLRDEYDALKQEVDNLTTGEWK